MTWLGLTIFALAVIGAVTQRIAKHVDSTFAADGERRNAGAL